jgi:hypothetical protein
MLFMVSYKNHKLLGLGSIDQPERFPSANRPGRTERWYPSRRPLLRASPATSLKRPPAPFFSSGRRKTAQSRPRFLVFARIWAFIHLASPGHPRPSGARSGTPDERNARETARKLPARRVAPTCRRERAVVILIVSSSARRRLPHASSSARYKSCRRWTSSHAARRVNARPPIYRGLPRVWPATLIRLKHIYNF